jgi:hypothetical protein
MDIAGSPSLLVILCEMVESQPYQTQAQMQAFKRLRIREITLAELTP